MLIDSANRIVFTTNEKGSIRVNFMRDTQVVVAYKVYDMEELVRYIHSNNFTRLARGIYVRSRSKLYVPNEQAL